MSLFIKIHDFVYKNCKGYNHFIRQLANIVNLECDNFSEFIKILDLPCITGNLCMNITKQKKINYFCGDINLENLIITKRKNATINLKLLLLDGENKLPFKPDSFNLIVVNNFIYYIKEKENFLKECNKILKPDGKLILSDIDLSKNAFDVLTKFGIRSFFDYVIWALPNYFFSFGKNLSNDQIENLFKHSDFEIEKKESVFYSKINLYVLKKC